MVNINVRVLRQERVWNTFTSTHTIATFEGAEDHDELTRMFQHFLPDINELSNNGISVGAANHKVTFWLGGDLKFLSVMYGLRGDFSSQFLTLLPTCDCNRDNLGDTSRDCNVRTLTNLRQLAHGWYGVAFTCPGCAQYFGSEEDVNNEHVSAAMIKAWPQDHCGVGYHQCVPAEHASTSIVFRRCTDCLCCSRAPILPIPPERVIVGQ
jgi:hypothetical protein